MSPNTLLTVRKLRERLLGTENSRPITAQRIKIRSNRAVDLEGGHIGQLLP